MEIMIVMGVYLLCDRAAYWFMSNMLGQVIGRIPRKTYFETAFPRLIFGIAGCLFLVIGKSPNFNTLNVVGLIAILFSLLIMGVGVFRDFSNRNQ
jgi:hypothetical protein